jgi:hypothetical protein
VTILLRARPRGKVGLPFLATASIGDPQRPEAMRCMLAICVY